MSEHEFQNRILNELRGLREDVSNIKKTIDGDSATKRRGLWLMVDDLWTAIYDPIKGVMARLGALEEDRTENKAEKKGERTVLTAIYVFIGGLAGWLATFFAGSCNHIVENHDKLPKP